MVEVAAIVAGWLTPTSLFVLLNIVIAIIFFTSAFGIGTATNHGGHTATKKSADDHHHHPESGGKPQLSRAPSFFSRVTSFDFSTHHYSNYYPHHSDDQAPPDPAFGRSPSLLSRVASFNFCRAQAQPDPAHDVSVVAQEAAAHHHHHHHDDHDDESKEGSETDRAGDESREKKMVMTEKKEDNEREGEAKEKKKKVVAVRRKKAKTVPFRVTDDDEVDAKADDFINKFKQQLKLQRLESLLRYRSPATVTAYAT